MTRESDPGQEHNKEKNRCKLESILNCSLGFTLKSVNDPGLKFETWEAEHVLNNREANMKWK